MPTTLLPYSPESFGLLCWVIQSDGSVSGAGTGGGALEPQTGAKNAGEAFALMPQGTRHRAIQLAAFDPDAPINATQLTDLNPDERLILERSIYPCLWARQDSDARLDDLESYTQLHKFSRAEMTPVPAAEGVDALVLVTPDAQPTRLPALQPRA